MFIRNALWSIPLAASLLLLGGCDSVKQGTIEGTVTLDGKPLASGTITFESPNARPASARIENGRIVGGTTLKEGDGIPLGTHRVAIAANEDAASAEVADPGKAKAPGANYMVGKSLIPTAYNNPETSGLTATIVAGNNVLKFELSSKGPGN